MVKNQMLTKLEQASLDEKFLQDLQELGPEVVSAFSLESLSFLENLVSIDKKMKSFQNSEEMQKLLSLWNELEHFPDDSI